MFAEVRLTANQFDYSGDLRPVVSLRLRVWEGGKGSVIGIRRAAHFIMYELPSGAEKCPPMVIFFFIEGSL